MVFFRLKTLTPPLNLIALLENFIGFDRKNIQYFLIRFLSIDLDRKSIRLNTYFYRKYPTRPTKIQSILIKLTFCQNFYGFLSNFPGTILCQKSNQMLSNMLSKIRIHFLRIKIQFNSIKNTIPHFYPL